MPEQKDRHLEAPGEANRDKHINFLAQESGDDDPASERLNTDADSNSAAGIDNGFFTEDDIKQTPGENETDKNHPPDKNEKNISREAAEQKTLGDNRNNDDILNRVTDAENTNYTNEDDQAH